MTDFDKAMRDPSAVFDKPKDVLKDDSLDREQKVEILKLWAYDAKQLLIAEEENMPGDHASMLNRCKRALQELGVEG